MAEMNETRQGELIDECWRILGQLIHTGTATLQTGRVVAPTTGDLVRTIERVAGMRKPKKTTTKIAEDYVLQRTE